MATKKDPTITTGSVDPMDPHSPTPEAAVLAAADPSRVHYEDNPGKPHETSIAQIQVVEEP